MTKIYVLTMIFTDGDFSKPRTFTSYEKAENFAKKLIESDIYEPVMYETFEINECLLF